MCTIVAQTNRRKKSLPFGLKLLQKMRIGRLFRNVNQTFCYRLSVLLLTYMAYTCYHMSRKTISVVKPVLHRKNCTLFHDRQLNLIDSSHGDEFNNQSGKCHWAPFDGSDADSARLLGELDSAFLFSYAFFMFVSGFIAERCNLRYFLTTGLLMTGVFACLFGVAKLYDIHNFYYFIVIQILSGIFQSTGWPGVVTVVSNWFGKGKRGLIFGLWNSHTSIGNILGTLIAGRYVEADWSLSFIVPGLITAVVGVLVFLFLAVKPSDVNIVLDENSAPPSNELSRTDGVETPLNGGTNAPYQATNQNSIKCESNERAVGFMDALRIPGVVEFSLTLFFSKLVNYTFLFWLPQYVNSSTTLGATGSAVLSTLFDVGGIFGGVVAGAVSDRTTMSATVCACMLLIAAPLIFLYEYLGVALAKSMTLNSIVLFFVGCFANGPYALITTSVSAELGTHSSLEGNGRALATVTAIIDGTGSIGAACGPFLAGYISGYGWNYVFACLIGSDILALLLLLRLVRKELAKRWRLLHTT